MELLKQKIEELKKMNPEMFGKDYLLTWEKSLDDIKSTLLIAEILNEMHRKNYSFKIFQDGIGISIFRDKSTRTRFSFTSACNALGLAVQELEEKKSQLVHGETVRETANMISFFTEVIGIRDDIFLGEGDKYQRNVAKAVQFGFDNGILHQRPTIINLQSDIDHPTQSMSDLAKISDRFRGLENLKGKKIIISWAYSPSYGKPLSVAQGMIGLLTRFGADVILAYPKGYELLPEVIDLSEKQTEESSGSFKITHDMKNAFQNADVVYPKSWASLKVMKQRRDLLHANNEKGLEELKKICLQENAKYIDWECTEEKMALTNDALYMHPLPADISGINCEQGEVSKYVFEKYLYDTYTQASFKPFIIAAMIFLSKIKNTTLLLEELLNNKIERKKINLEEN